jgi:hypothetical protein
VTFLAHSLKLERRLEIYKALQSLGEVCFAETDEETAVSLFTTALQDFTHKDVAVVSQDVFGPVRHELQADQRRFGP